MHLRNSFISTTRCDDLARATEAQDGKKNGGAEGRLRVCTGEKTGGQLVYAFRSGPSRLARNLDRASSGDIHACTLSLISAARHLGWVVCMGFLRDRDKVEAWGTVRR